MTKKLGVVLTHRINVLARELYKLRGYQIEEGYDFSKATHPHEVEAWQAAYLSCCYWTGLEVEP